MRKIKDKREDGERQRLEETNEYHSVPCCYNKAFTRFSSIIQSSLSKTLNILSLSHTSACGFELSCLQTLDKDARLF